MGPLQLTEHRVRQKGNDKDANLNYIYPFSLFYNYVDN